MNSKSRNLFLLITALIFAIARLNCSSGSLVKMIENKDEITFPEWNLSVNVPLMEKTIRLSEMLEPNSILGEAISSMKDASFDRVNAEDIILGGKYYYPECNNFGLRVGDYVINYRVTFPGSANLMSQGGLDTSVDAHFDSNYIYSVNVPIWPVPINQNLNPGLGDLNFVDLSSLNLDINGDSSSDIYVLGAVSEGASLSLRVWLENNGDTVVPDSDTIAINSLRIEGVDYIFNSPVTRTDGLYFEASNFLRPDSTPAYYIDFGGDPANDYTKLNFEVLSITLRQKTPTRYNNCVLKIEAIMNFGDDYKLIGDIYPMRFELGVQPVDISNLDTTVDADKDGVAKLLAHFVSSLSLENAAIYFNAQNTLPLSIDITDFFDNVIDATIDPPQVPTPLSANQNGGIISYFDLTGDSDTDTYELLSFDNPQSVIIEGWTGGAPNETKTVLYSGNSNMGNPFIEKAISGDYLRRPKGLFFINNFETLAMSAVEIGMLSQGGGLTLQSGLIIPMSIKVLSYREGEDILDAMGFSDLSTSFFNDIPNAFPLKDIDDVVFRINFTNHLPVGVNLLFCITDPSSDEIVYLQNGDDLSADIIYGNLFLGDNGEYYVGENSISDFVLGVKKDFKYYISGIENIYDGSFYSYLKQKNNIKMQLRISLKPTNDKNGNPISVRISDDNYFTVKVGLVGRTTWKL